MDRAESALLIMSVCRLAKVTLSITDSATSLHVRSSTHQLGLVWQAGCLGKVSKFNRPRCELIVWCLGAEYHSD